MALKYPNPVSLVAPVIAWISTSIVPSSLNESWLPPAITFTTSICPIILSSFGNTTTWLAFPPVTTALAATSASAKLWLAPSRPAYSSVTITVLTCSASIFFSS